MSDKFRVDVDDRFGEEDIVSKLASNEGPNRLLSILNQIPDLKIKLSS
jgi:hypothetical protein